MIDEPHHEPRFGRLEENLLQGLGLNAINAHWVSRLGCDLAERSDTALLDMRGTAQLNRLVGLIREHGFESLLEGLSYEDEVFARNLATLDCCGTFGVIRRAS